MLDQKKFKQSANNLLRRSFFKTALVCLIEMLAFLAIFVGAVWITSFFYFLVGYHFLFFFILLGIGAGLIIYFMLFIPLKVGICRYFFALRQNDERLSDVLFGFRSGLWDHIIHCATMRLMHIAEFFNVAMIPSILAENPKSSPARTLRLSSLIVMNCRNDMYQARTPLYVRWFCVLLAYFLLVIFGMLLNSYIALALMLLCYLAILYTLMYYECANTELYFYLSDIAIQEGLCDDADFDPSIKKQQYKPEY